MTWPVHYPGRPAIPYDPTPETGHWNMMRSVRRLAESGKRRGAPVKQIPHFIPNLVVIGDWDVPA